MLIGQAGLDNTIYRLNVIEGEDIVCVLANESVDMIDDSID